MQTCVVFSDDTGCLFYVSGLPSGRSFIYLPTHYLQPSKNADPKKQRPFCCFTIDCAEYAHHSFGVPRRGLFHSDTRHFLCIYKEFHPPDDRAYVRIIGLAGPGHPEKFQKPMDQSGLSSPDNRHNLPVTFHVDKRFSGWQPCE